MPAMCDEQQYRDAEVAAAGMLSRRPLSAAMLVLTGAVISGGVVLPRRLPKEHTAESTPEDTLSRDLAALMNYGREEDNDEI